MSDLVRAVIDSGGLTRRHVLVEAFGRRAVDRALATGELEALERDRYVLPETAEAPRLAHQVTGLLCLTSAALHYGWEVAVAPDRPHVVVPRGRRVDPVVAARLRLHRGAVGADDRAGLATGVELTLDQCGRRLPFTEALAVTDSALRHGVTSATLRRVARSARGAGAPQLRRVMQLASLDAANPFESTLRGIGEDVPGLRLVPQV